MISIDDVRMISLSLRKAGSRRTMGDYDGRVLMVAAAKVNKSVVYGHNKYNKSHPSSVRVADDGFEYSSIHAEFDLMNKIRKVSNNGIVGRTIYVAGCTDKGTIVTSKPCSSCLIDVKNYGIFDRVVYVVRSMDSEITIEEYFL